MLDQTRIEHRLLDLERYCHRLSDIMPEEFDEYKESTHETKAAAERYLQLISDIEFEIAMRLYKARDLAIAGDEETLLDRIQPLLGKRVADAMRLRRALRNKLIHAYYDVTYDEDVFDLGNQLNDVDEFIKGVKKALSLD